LELKTYILPLRKWWWLIVAATLVATVSSFLATRQQPPIYQTRTTVIIGNSMNNPNPNSYDYYQSQQLAATYADIVQRDAVRQAAMQALGLRFLPDYSARTVPSTQLIEITVTDTDPVRAQAVAKELVNQLIAISPSGQNGEAKQRQAFISGQLNELEDKIKATQSEITKKQGELTGLFSARQIADAQTQIAALQNKLASMQTNYTALLSNTQQGARNALSTLEEARLPTSPIGPNKSATILLAAVIGFALAAAAAYLLEYLDDTMKNPEDVEKALGLTTLGAAPVMKLEDGAELVVVTHAQSPISEAYRVLRTNLQFAEVGHPLHTLMVTSAGPGEGKSLTAANLAAALAQGGRQVILVDGDLHRPRQHRVFGLRNNTGVTTALITGVAGNLDHILQDTSVPGLRLLTSGPLPPNAAELLGSTRMRELLADLLTRADIVVIDSPPVTALSDAAVLSTQTDGVLLVVDAGKTRREMARRATEALERVHARVIGVLLNRMPSRGAGYYYYYRYDDYYTPADGSSDNSGANGRYRRRRKHTTGQPTANVPADRTPSQV
jgi:succinoglycan biosynthesis transport protein ExoP